MRIGATGHRDPHPRDVTAAQAALDAVFRDLRQRLPSTPLQLVTGLAKGADRLAARVALRHGIPVVALLPMPLAEYTADFPAESLAEFRDLLAQPGVTCTQLPLPPGLQRRAGSLTQEDKAGLYRRLGESLSGDCTLIIALWDGENSGRMGGTWEVVLRFLGALPEPQDPLRRIEFTDAGPGDGGGSNYVCWIPVRRVGTEAAHPSSSVPVFISGNVGPCRLRRHSGLPSGLQATLRELDARNAR